MIFGYWAVQNNEPEGIEHSFALIDSNGDSPLATVPMKHACCDQIYQCYTWRTLRADYRPPPREVVHGQTALRVVVVVGSIEPRESTGLYHRT